MKPDNEIGSTMYKAMQEVTSAVNIMSEKELEEGMLNALLDEHRTLQQSFFRVLHNVLEQYADTKYYDLRNEASVEYAKKVRELDHYFPLI